MKKLAVLIIIMLFSGLAACENEPNCTEDQELVNNVCTQKETEETEETEETDTTSPVITGFTDIEFTIGDEEADFSTNIIATDNKDGDLTANIIIDSSAVDLAIAGTYKVSITVSDAAGNSTTEEFDVIVSELGFSGEELAQLDIDLLDFSEGINLPIVGTNGTSFKWSSSHPYIVTKSGLVIPPPVGSESVNVTLSADVRNGTFTDTISYSFMIEPSDEVIISDSRLLPFDNESIRYVLDETKELELFYEDEGNVPYVDIEEFLEFIDGSINSSLLNYTYTSNSLTIEYTQNEFVYDGYMANGTYFGVFDFTNNTLEVSSYDFFKGYSIPSELNPYEKILYLSHESTEVSETIIPLGEYNIDLTIYNDGEGDHYLMPFHIANLIFLHSLRFNVYYNGVKLTGYDDAYVAWDENELDQALYEMNFSPLNQEDLPYDLRIASYHFLAFNFDYFHGLRSQNEQNNFYEVLIKRVDDFLKKSELNFSLGVWETLLEVDDPGTWYSRVGFYDNNPLSYHEPSYSNSSARIKSLFENFYSANQVIDTGLGINIADQYISAEDIDKYLPEYRLVDDDKTVVIYLVHFFDSTPEDVKEILDNLPLTVENVVFDTSVSFYGKPQIAIELLGFMTDQSIEYSVQNTFDGQTSTYNVTINQPYYEYNYYIISSGFTYLSANIFIQIAKDNQLATHLGEKTFGGTCPLTSVTMSDGTNFMMTSTTMFMRKTGNEVDGFIYRSYENGLSPDITVVEFATEESIIEAINQSQSN